MSKATSSWTSVSSYGKGLGLAVVGLDESTHHINEDTKIQFDLLAELQVVFARARMRFWLRGDWGMDFHLGHITRSHSDIDIVTWKRHAPRVKRVLIHAGYEFTRDLGIQMDFRKDGQDISVVYFGRKQDGTIYTPDAPDWEWLCGCLLDQPFRLRDVSCRSLSLEQLLDEKLVYESGTGRPPREKDLNSMRLLRQMIAERSR